MDSSYHQQDDQFNLNRSTYCLVYRNLSTIHSEPLTRIMELNNQAKPVRIDSISQQNDNDTYNLAVTVKYSERMVITSCNHFQIYGVIPSIPKKSFRCDRWLRSVLEVQLPSVTLASIKYQTTSQYWEGSGLVKSSMTRRVIPGIAVKDDIAVKDEMVEDNQSWAIYCHDGQ